jgi:hypothetical protein
MKEFSVSIDIKSDVCTLAELVKRTGLAPGLTSHERGGFRIDGSVWNETVLRYEARTNQTNDLLDLLKVLLPALPPNLKSSLSCNDRICLNIAVYYDAAMCSA